MDFKKTLRNYYLCILFAVALFEQQQQPFETPVQGCWDDLIRGWGEDNKENSLP